MLLDKVLNQISIEQVIASRISLKKKGREFEALCPFHNEKTASFKVDQHKGFYYCFGCHEKETQFHL